MDCSTCVVVSQVLSSTLKFGRFVVLFSAIVSQHFCCARYLAFFLNPKRWFDSTLCKSLQHPLRKVIIPKPVWCFPPTQSVKPNHYVSEFHQHNFTNQVLMFRIVSSSFFWHMSKCVGKVYNSTVSSCHHIVRRTIVNEQRTSCQIKEMLRRTKIVIQSRNQ